MTEREKVIKGLECCVWTDERLLTDCENCPYSNGRGCCNSLRGLHMDALALLKEKEPAQVIKRKAMHMLFWCCGSCGVAITDGDKFCRMCGRAVKWDD